MEDIFYLGPLGTVHVLGIKLVGINADNVGKFLITLSFIIIAFILNFLLKKISALLLTKSDHIRRAFWTRQGINLFTAVVGVLGVCSIWFDDPTRLTTALGLITAGLAFALQKVVTSIAGYFVILRGQTFNVGDRIVMGGVRGDVLALRFTQTTIMEMGQPAAVQNADPAMWVKSRQYTGRIVVVPNSKIFDEPIYNYTKDFDYIWEELAIPISYKDNRILAESILLEAAKKHHIGLEKLNKNELDELNRRFYSVNIEPMEPKVYFRLTDNWLELSVRFMTDAHGVRDVKDAISREILAKLEANNIGIASATFDLTNFPPLQVQIDDRSKRSEKT